MTNKKHFTQNEIWSMNADTFSKTFYSKNAKVSLEDGHVACGIILEIGLAANSNVCSEEHLPVSIKIGCHTVLITNINYIELL